MENRLTEILDLASMSSPNNYETKEEFLECLKQKGGVHFMQYIGIIFTTNEHGILDGIGFDSFGDFKIWNNSKFGTYKKTL